MAYGAYRSSPNEITIVEAPLESQLTGLRVGRCEVWPIGLASGEQIRNLVEVSDFDISIIRYPAADVRFAWELQSPHLYSWQADTLLYFERDVNGRAAASPGLVLEQIDASQRQRVELMILDTFRDYRNHYSATPLLDAIDIGDAYRDWTSRSLDSQDVAVLVGRSDDVGDVGVIVLDEAQSDFCEVLLAGVVPTHRRQGYYSAILDAVAARAASRGARVLAISTQAANIGVMRAWCRGGFLPTVALNTLHVAKEVAFLGNQDPESVGQGSPDLRASRDSLGWRPGATTQLNPDKR